MSRWTLAEWVGPTPNRYIGGMVEWRGLVLHIMEGSYDGSIAWGKNPASQVSFHFANRKDGHLGQLVDTGDGAWTQGDGNGNWLSVEHEGFSGEALTAAQLESTAQIYAQGVREHGWAYELADSPAGRGLGWHGMGGLPWGGHPNCPGDPIVGQREAILARARQINNEEDGMTPEERNWLYNAVAIATGLAEGADSVECRWAWTGDGHQVGDPFTKSLAPFWARLARGGAGGGPSHDELVAAAFEGAQKAEQE